MIQYIHVVPHIKLQKIGGFYADRQNHPVQPIGPHGDDPDGRGEKRGEGIRVRECRKGSSLPAAIGMRGS